MVTTNDMKGYLQKRVKFNTYRKWKERVCVVKLNKEEWMLSTCTCAKYQNEHVCTHTIGVAALEKLLVILGLART